MLRLDFAYARLSDSIGVSAPIEMVRVAQRRNLTAQPQEVGQALNPWLTGDPATLAFSDAESDRRREALDRALAAGASG